MTATWGSARSALSKFSAFTEIILLNLLCWASAQGGGQNVSREFFFWGVGGETYCRACSPKQLWRPQNLGLVWSVPLSFKGNDRATRGEGETYCRWGGSKNVFGEGFYAEFAVCVPPPLSFPPPLPLSDYHVRGFEKELADRGGWRKEIPPTP